MSSYAPFSSDGYQVRWTTWDGEHDEVLTLTWENEGWTASGVVGRERVQYVLRLSPTWHVRQFILFRDLDEPDLWLATDGAGRWGEMNGAHRVELDGCVDVHLDVTPFTLTAAIRRLPLQVGDAAELPVIRIDVETLDTRGEIHRLTRVGEHRWQLTVPGSADPIGFDVDEHGVVLDLPGRFRRAS